MLVINLDNGLENLLRFEIFAKYDVSLTFLFSACPTDKSIVGFRSILASTLKFALRTISNPSP